MINNNFTNSILPDPTKEIPYIQVDWIFEERASLCNTKSTKNNYISACTFYKKYLLETGNYNSTSEDDSRFYIENEWDNLALHKVKSWIDATNVEGADEYLTSYTIAGHFSAIRQTMIYAYECGYSKHLVADVIMQHGVRETKTRAAFTTEEYEAIFKVINPLIKFSRGLLKPYEKTGIGKDPRVRIAGRRREKLLGHGWACWRFSSDGKEMIPSDENIRWYFENVLECRPIPCTEEYKIKHKHFLDMAGLHHGGLNNLYRKWGVSSCIDQFVIMPLVVKLIAETGLNVESILSLRRDCFKGQEHLTYLPCIEYYKSRSGGEKILVLELFDGKKIDKEYLKLGQKQSQIIRETINTILALTEPLVEMAEDEDKDFLLLYQRSGSTDFGKVTRIKKWVMRRWTKNLVQENDLRDRDGNKLELNLTRFRPTKITELVQQGHDIFSLMSIAGHSSIRTTLSYIDKLKFAENFHATIQRELENIKNNAYEQRNNPLPIATGSEAEPGTFIFKSASFSFCKNPYDPPNIVRNAKNYFEGDPCTYFNMCLQCKNILITEMNLPKLAAYRNEIIRALKNGIEDMPRQGELYKKNLAILDEIFTPNVVFSEAILNKAIQIADDVEFDVIDSFIY
jgi:hypothetical protein